MAWFTVFAESGQKMLVVWSAPLDTDQVQACVSALKDVVGSSGQVSLENYEFLEKSAHPRNTFDVVLSGVFEPYNMDHSLDALDHYLHLLKAGGQLVVCEKSGQESLTSRAKISGFSTENSTDGYKIPSGIACVILKKPDFDVGSSVPLNLGQNAKVWSLDSDDLQDNDLINPDSLLTEEDKKKPDADALKVCKTTGKRKACKDCSCGLAEELAGVDADQQKEKSACGNCYLGDAFRCSTCPHLGTPPFKPGEKVVLDLGE
jgi:hypothetical protein